MCHDGTGTYKKFPTDCGHPAYEEKKFGGTTYQTVDLGNIARNIKKSSRNTCGACHFFGGGGDGVKHGDLDSSMFAPDKSLDVHMDVKGLNYNCTVCHTARSHDIVGRKYSRAAPNTHRLALPEDTGLRIGCENCHSSRPHKNNQNLNDHTDTVACQTCHIPYFARGGIATQLDWDWSTAGKHTADGKAIVKKDSDGNVIYHTKKGTMAWGTSLEPEYAWYRGVMTYIQQQDIIDPSTVVALNRPLGSYADRDARIYPFKVHQGKQPFDAESNRLVVPKLFGKKGSGAYWAEYDWTKAANKGMEAYGAPFSGSIGFIETTFYSPLNHMIAPKEASLACGECHSRSGRLAALTSFYLPGRDRSGLVDALGWTAVWLSLAGILIHGVLRFILKK